MTTTQWLLLPAFTHVALVFFVGGRMGRARFQAARAGLVKVKDIAVDGAKWPEDVKKIANNYQNQFEVPVLFYALLPLLTRFRGSSGWARSCSRPGASATMPCAAPSMRCGSAPTS